MRGPGVDHYGNCQLNVDPLELLSITDSPGGEVIVTIGAGSATPDERVGVRVDAYDQIPAGRIGLVVDSSGLLSIAVARGSAARELELGEGIELRIRDLDPSDRGPGVARRYSSVPAPPEDSDARKYHAGDRHPAARHPRRSGVAVRLAGRLRRRPTSGPTRRFRVCRPHRKWSESSGGSGREPAKMVRCEPRDPLRRPPRRPHCDRRRW